MTHTIAPVRFVTLEGPDGSGKSTQARLLGERLTAAGFQVVVTREPGGTRLGEQVREIVLGAGRDLDPRADAMLFSAQRAQHVAEVIGPALATGRLVVCDRHRDSTIAYQGYGSGLDVEAMTRLQDIATAGLLPDLTILFDLPVDVGLERRMSGPADDRNKFELDRSFDAEYHERVRAGYLRMASAGGRWRVVDAARAPEQVAADVAAIVLDAVGAGPRATSG
jgi:dTMP kinase